MTTTAYHYSTELPCVHLYVDILLIDDDVNLRTVLAAALQRQGYSVVVAHEGKTALQLFSNHTFRLVITDIFMPVMDGLEVIMKSFAAGRTIPILAISGGGMMGEAECVLKPAGLLGCRRALAKPFEMPEFLSAVEALIGRK
jgi:CheY-like chemotaxis protein